MLNLNGKNAPLKIIIKATHIAEGGGLTHLNKMIEWFGKLAPRVRFVLIGKTGQEKMLISSPSNFKYKFFRLPSLNLAARLFWERFMFRRILKKSAGDLLFEPGNTGTVNPHCPKVSLIHNIAPFDEENFRNESIYQRLRNRALRSETVKNIESSAGLIMLSNKTKELLGGYLDSRKSRTAVIYHGGTENRHCDNDESVLAHLGISGEYILSVSHIYRYKKLKELVEGYLCALNRNPKLPQLFHAGTSYDAKYMNSIIEIVKQSPHAHRVKFLGNVDSHRLQTLYRNSKVFVFSSVLENCPVILIEALANACAIACSNKSVMPEICGEAAIYFDSNDVEDIADKILCLCENEELNASLREKATEMARKYSWEKSAAETLKFFREILDMNDKTTQDQNELKVSDLSIGHRR